MKLQLVERSPNGQLQPLPVLRHYTSQSKPREAKLKSEIVLQLIIFSLFAAIIGLLAIRLYPSELVKKLKPEHQNPPQEHVLAAVEEKGNSKPASIAIPTLNLHLPVAPGIVKNNQWTLYEDKISWLATSEPPGSGKNVILYGHNRPLLFGKLTSLQIGEEITVIDSSGVAFTYTVAQKRKVAPVDVDVIISAKNQLTLYTCEGSFDQKRLVVIAYPKT